MDFRLPVADGSVDRIILASVFTHLLPTEVLHYMREFRRALKPSGLVYARGKRHGRPLLRIHSAMEPMPMTPPIRAALSHSPVWDLRGHTSKGGGPAFTRNPRMVRTRRSWVARCKRALSRAKYRYAGPGRFGFFGCLKYPASQHPEVE
jgi:methyltransferase family protein